MHMITMASRPETCLKKIGLAAGLESVVRRYFRLIVHSMFVTLALSLVCLNFLSRPAGRAFLRFYLLFLRMRAQG